MIPSKRATGLQAEDIKRSKEEAQKITNREVGFIGGGRATRIILGGFANAGKMPRRVVVSDTDGNVLDQLKAKYPGITTALNDNRLPASSRDMLFISVHPPVLKGIAGEIRSRLNPEATVVSLMATVSIAELSREFGGFQRIVRMTPNAPSIVNAGYNPVAFSGGFTEMERDELLDLLSVLGECPVVAEEKLETYAILTAMGPTYLWFQLYELEKLGRQFGLTGSEVERGISGMITGAVKTMHESGLSADEVMDLVPIKPIGDGEDEIKRLYRSKLEALHARLKG
jgi:pyrroline-5-carboxylate reductase